MSGIQQLNCIVLVTDEVKSKLKHNITNLVTYNVTIINNIRQLTKEMVETTTKVIIVGDYNYDALDDLRLYKSVFNLTYYLISDNKMLLTLMKGYCNTYEMDYTDLTNTMIYSVLYDDRVEQERNKVTEFIDSNAQLSNNIIEESKDEKIISLAKNHLKLLELLEDRIKCEKEMTDKVTLLESDIVTYLGEIDSLNYNYTNLVAKVMEQSKVLKDYEIYFTQDFYNKVSLAKYKNRPLILYFKEYQDLIHEHSFLTTIFNMITIQAGRSCKIVRLHDSNDLARIKSLEDEYYIVNSSFLESEIVSHDYILSIGNYGKLFDLILRNDCGLNVLIIYDCKKYDDIALEGTDMVYYNVCRNSDIAEKLELDPDFTIVNNKNGNPLSWNTYKEYVKLQSNSNRFEYLSSRPVMMNIYKQLKYEGGW